MMWFVLLSPLLLTAAHPIEELPYTLTTDVPIEIQNDLNVVSYIQGFKLSMTDYVTSQYKNLTIRETEEVKEALETFLRNFAKDLKTAVERQMSNEESTLNITTIPDGIPDSTFNDINLRVRTEFTDINEETAKEIVYKLRKNLYETRQKLDLILQRSEQSQMILELEAKVTKDGPKYTQGESKDTKDGPRDTQGESKDTKDGPGDTQEESKDTKDGPRDTQGESKDTKDGPGDTQGEFKNTKDGPRDTLEEIIETQEKPKDS